MFDRAVPPDLDTLLPAENVEAFGEGYLAVVHADGNGLGKMFSGLGDLETYRRTSAAVAAATEKAVQDAVRLLVRKVGPTPSDQRRIPFRPVVLGGDDFTAILRAEDAIPFVVHFLRRFAELTKSNDALANIAGGLSASAGIAIVKSGFPFRLAHRLAEELCVAAKKPFRASTPPASALMFHRVTSASLRSLEDIREHELSAYFDGGRTAGGLMGGPWTADRPGGSSIGALSKIAHALKAFPRGTIREWLRLVATSPDAAQSHWNRIRDVAGFRDGTAWSDLDTALQGAGCKLGQPWGDAGATGLPTTPLLDALIWNRISGGKPELW